MHYTKPHSDTIINGLTYWHESTIFLVNVTMSGIRASNNHFMTVQCFPNCITGSDLIKIFRFSDAFS